MANSWLELMLKDKAMSQFLDVKKMRQKKQVLEAPIDFDMFLYLINNGVEVQVTEKKGIING